MRRRYLLLIFWLAVVAVGVFSLAPDTSRMPTTGWDKSNHALAFLVLGYLGSLCWPAVAPRVVVALAAYGAAIEVAQATLTTTHVGDWKDWVADLVGLLLAVLYIRWRGRASHP